MQGNHRDKPIVEFDPEIERTLKKNRNRVRTQRSLQFDREEASSEEVVSEKSFEEEIQDNMADHTNNQWRTIADYQNPTTSYGSSIVWPTVDANNFELKPALVQLVQQNQFGVTKFLAKFFPPQKLAKSDMTSNPFNKRMENLYMKLGKDTRI
ncbi:hypothetical protein PIB30_108643, partial [Stylosanthes scabra]|nr:hypothetical protein [Stylosanthes scabra]